MLVYIISYIMINHVETMLNWILNIFFFQNEVNCDKTCTKLMKSYTPLTILLYTIYKKTNYKPNFTTYSRCCIIQPTLFYNNNHLQETVRCSKYYTIRLYLSMLSKCCQKAHFFLWFLYCVLSCVEGRTAHSDALKIVCSNQWRYLIYLGSNAT